MNQAARPRAITDRPQSPGAIVAAGPFLVAGAALIGWLNALRAPFIFDDRPHILDNALIRHLGPPWDAVLHTTRPLVGLTLALNYAFGRFDVVGYHALNLGLHVATGLALLAVLRVTLDSAALPSSVRSRGPSLALAITLLWVVHPITTAAVTVTIQRAEVLAALCTLDDTDRRRARGGGSSRRHHAGGIRL